MSKQCKKVMQAEEKQAFREAKKKILKCQCLIRRALAIYEFDKQLEKDNSECFI
jgi:hypothetical protein